MASDTSTVPATAFPLFPDLPPELRALVWEFCLPHRVRELNELDPEDQWPYHTWSHDHRVWKLNELESEDQWPEYTLSACTRPEGDTSRPCSITSTTKANNRPPLITQVCREARRVAFLAAGSQMAIQADQSDALRWDKAPWTDYSRDTPHFHQNDEDDETYTLATLADSPWDHAQGRSFSYHHLNKYPAEGDCAQYDECTVNERPRYGDLPRVGLPDSNLHPKVYRDAVTLLEKRDWRLVTDTVVIHATGASLAGTGLFGLLGDAPIQIVDVLDKDRISLFYELAELGERAAVNCGRTQNFPRCSLKDWERFIRHYMWCNRYPDALLSHVRPAIMFRLCTRMCNLAESGTGSS